MDKEKIKQTLGKFEQTTERIMRKVEIKSGRELFARERHLVELTIQEYSKELDSLIDEIRKIEDKLDKINVEYGSHDELCIFCKSKDYNSKVGIAHYEGCVMARLRKIGRLKNIYEKSSKVEKEW